MFQDLPPQTQINLSDLSPILSGAGGLIAGILSSIVAHRLAKKKTDSETIKNLSDAKKIEAETDKIHAETIEILNTELTEVLEKAKKLRVDVGDLEEQNSELVRAAKTAEQVCAEKHRMIQDACAKDRNHILSQVEAITSDYSKVVDELIGSQSATPKLRIDAAKSLEKLHALRGILQKQERAEDMS